MVYRLRWSEEAVRNLEEIIRDIKYKWTEREVNNFKDKLSYQLDLIIHNPYMFPTSNQHSRLRKAVLSKQTSVFYEIHDKVVFLAYLHINKKDIVNIK